jgi:hypothetical protein
VDNNTFVVLPDDFLGIFCPINIPCYWVGLQFFLNGERPERDNFFRWENVLLVYKY